MQPQTERLTLLHICAPRLLNDRSVLCQRTGLIPDLMLAVACLWDKHDAPGTRATFLGKRKQPSKPPRCALLPVLNNNAGRNAAVATILTYIYSISRKLSPSCAFDSLLSKIYDFMSR